MRALYDPSVKPKVVPNLFTRMYDNDTSRSYNNERSSYRVESYYKAVPNSLKIGKDEPVWKKKMMRRLLGEWSPNWASEYKLIPCLQDEATHVSGYGVCGVVCALNDERYEFTNIDIGWTAEQIQEGREQWTERVLNGYHHPAMVVEGVRHTFKYARYRTFKGKRYEEQQKEFREKYPR